MVVGMCAGVLDSVGAGVGGTSVSLGAAVGLGDAAGVGVGVGVGAGEAERSGHRAAPLPGLMEAEPAVGDVLTPRVLDWFVQLGEEPDMTGIAVSGGDGVLVWSWGGGTRVRSVSETERMTHALERLLSLYGLLTHDRAA